MNLVDFLMYGGVTKTAAGHIVTLSDIKPDEKYPIKGAVNWKNGHQSELEWDENGYPEDRRTHHQLNLVPVISVLHLYPLSNKVLEQYDDFTTLWETESNRIKNKNMDSNISLVMKVDIDEGC